MIRVEKLTDDVPAPNVTWEPFGKIGDICPSCAVDGFQREMFNSCLYFGTRSVQDSKGQAFFQALVRSFGDLQWINLYRVRVTGE